MLLPLATQSPVLPHGYQLARPRRPQLPPFAAGRGDSCVEPGELTVTPNAAAGMDTRQPGCRESGQGRVRSCLSWKIKLLLKLKICQQIKF